MHYWGDGFEYFRDVGNAANDIGIFCRRWGRISVSQTKEKFGTARVYCSFGVPDLQTLFWPGYHYIQYPRHITERFRGTWYSVVTFPFFAPVDRLIVKWQAIVYRLAYKRALKKYPHIREEILDCPDWDEYLKGL